MEREAWRGRGREGWNTGGVGEGGKAGGQEGGKAGGWEGQKDGGEGGREGVKGQADIRRFLVFELTGSLSVLEEVPHKVRVSEEQLEYCLCIS